MKYIYRTSPCGEIKGIGAKDYHLFKGVRYATAKRWEAPEEVTSWEGVYDATVPGPWCYQWNSFMQERSGPDQFYYDETVEKQTVLYSEDCLYLNIWRPTEGENLPVLVYIHGGSYETGGGSNPSFNGQAYCERGLVYITINYRLNAFASAYGDGIEGNFGIQDQACALRWIKHNIAAFGGDPEKVTIMGESAGAMSVQNMIFTPLAAGLFRGAIMLSGGGILQKSFQIRTPEGAAEIWENVKQRLSAKNMEELKSVEPGKLFCTWKEFCNSDPRFAFPTTPVIDGAVIPDDPRRLAEEGRVNGVPTICGVLSEDMWPLRLYRAIVEWGELMEQAGLPEVYGFYLDRAVPGSDHGAYHGCDQRYAFGTLDTSWRPYDEIDYRISDNMMDFFSNFTKNGVPAVDDLAEWKPIRGGNRQFMHFGDETCAMVDVPEDRLDAFQKLRRPFPNM